MVIYYGYCGTLPDGTAKEGIRSNEEDFGTKEYEDVSHRRPDGVGKAGIG